MAELDHRIVYGMGLAHNDFPTIDFHNGTLVTADNNVIGELVR
jgi:hypothetical protein